MGKLETELETLVDRDGLAAVLEALCNVCAEKADHVRVSYGTGELHEGVLSKAWSAASATLLSVAGRSAILNVSPEV